MTADPNNPVKKYMFSASRNKWVISISSDSGIIQLMKDLHAESFTSPKSPGKSYWLLAECDFRSIQSILNASGYSEYTTPPSASFKSLPPRENPDFNPIKFPALLSLNKANAATFLQSHTYTVSEFNRDFKTGLRSCFPLQFWISGEIADLSFRNGHAFFKLIEHIETPVRSDINGNCDINYSLNCIIWNKTYSSFQKRIQSGMLPPLEIGKKIRGFCKIDSYEINSTLSFIIQDIDAYFAEGDFFKQKDLIYRKLYEMGIHDKNLNLPMPVLPLRLAVFSKNKTMTSEEAAGWGDFAKVLNDSGFPFRITVFPVALQGKDVDKSFSNAFDCLEKIGFAQFDLGIIIRGGGSLLDLSCFNSLEIARRVALSPLKFIVGIGHEKDRCVLDEIASREKTPTAVAEALCKICQNLTDHLNNARNNIISTVTARMDFEQNHLQQLANSCANLTHQQKESAQANLQNLRNKLTIASTARISDNKLMIQSLSSAVQNAGKQRILNAQNDIRMLHNNIQTAAKQTCSLHTQALQQYFCAIQNSAKLNIQTQLLSLQKSASLLKERTESAKMLQKTLLDTLSIRLDALSPESQFKRGFVLLSDKSGNRISSVQQVKTNDPLSVHMLDGKLAVTVDDVSKHQ